MIFICKLRNAVNVRPLVQMTTTALHAILLLLSNITLETASTSQRWSKSIDLLGKERRPSPGEATEFLGFLTLIASARPPI